jgi:hypothetical protein
MNLTVLEGSLVHFQDSQLFYLLHIVYIPDFVYFLLQLFNCIVELVEFEATL